MMSMCWNSDANKRPDFSELVEMLSQVVIERRTEQPHYMNINNGTTHNGHAIQCL